MKKLIIFLTMGCGLVLNSCIDQSIIYEENKPLDGNIWERDSGLVFTFDIKDTSKTNVLSCYIRNYNDYQYCNLYLNYSVLDSNSAVLKTELKELLLYNPKSGEPLGEIEMFSDAQTGIYLLDTLTFKESGKYRVVIKQQMRNLASLENIQSVGIQVKNTH